MDIKEAIKFSETIKFRLSYLEEIQQKQIIELLKRGEKFEAIVKELVTSRYFSTIDNRYLREVKQKYFPKEK